MYKYLIRGAKPLQGKVKVSGSKNAALPIICATLLANSASSLHNIPDIEDVKSLFTILKELGVKILQKGSSITIDPRGLKKKKPNKNLVQKMRASVLLAGPLLIRHGDLNMAFPGGCVLGKRTLHAHTFVFKKFGGKIHEEKKALQVELKSRKNAPIVMPEASVTATENALMIAAATKGKTEIRLAACEPHVQDLCHALNKMGAKIRGIGTHHLVIEGTDNLRGIEHAIIGDYLEVGTFALATAITKGDVTIEGFPMFHLDSFWQKFEEANIPYELKENSVRIQNIKKIKPLPQLKTAIHPSFPTDLQAPFAVILTQAEGVSKIFETLFDGRLSYLFELEKMGARIEILNPHQAIIIGPTPLKGSDISSCDIRAGAAMVIAALGATGETTISNIAYIDRGYEQFDEKLAALGAQIQRMPEDQKEDQKMISTVPSRSVRRIETSIRFNRSRVSG